MPSIETQRGSLFYAGRYEGVPLVLVHGAGGTHLDWPGAVRRLPNVLALDLPGHGKSPLPGRTTIEDYARDVLALLDALDIPQAVVAGHSMGGAIVQTLALIAPDRLCGMVLVGTGAKLSVHPDILDRVLVAPEEVATLLKDWIWSESVPERPREIGYQQLMRIPPEVIHGDYQACSVFDIRERLGEITTPTLVIGGTEDRMTRYKFSVYLQENLPDAQLFTVENAGHMMTLEQPEVVTHAIQTWWEGLECSS